MRPVLVTLRLDFISVTHTPVFSTLLADDLAVFVYLRSGPENGRLRGVFRGDDIVLHLVLDTVGRIADSHYALVERPPSTDAVIAADAENNSSLFLHWIVAILWARAVVECRQRAGCSIAAAESPPIWAALKDGSKEAVRDRWAARVLLGVNARE